MKNKCLFFLSILIVLSSCTPPVKKVPISTRNIYYAGGENKVKEILLHIGYILVEDISEADVFVLNDEIHSPYAIQAMVRNKGKGLVLIPGEHIMHYGVDMDVQALLGQTVADLFPSNEPISLSVVKDFVENDLFIKEIDWKTAPQVLDRAWLSMPGPGVLLITREGYSESILDKLPNNQFYLSVYLDDQHNLEFQEWEYFDYLIYCLVERAASAKPLSYSDFSELYR